MIESIALLGHLENEKNSSDDISRMIENCYRYNSKKQQQVAGINIDITNNIPVFKDVILFDLRPEHSRKMLYRGGNGTGANPSPSAAKTQNDTLTRKIYAFFNKALDVDFLTAEERQWLSDVYQCLQDNDQVLRTKIDDICANRNKGDSLFLTLIFTKGDELLFVADIPLFVKLFRFFNTPNTVSKGTCSICKKQDVTVMPASSSQTYKFFNLDKRGFFWGLLENKDPVSFPVCLDCLYDIEKGKEYIKNKLNFMFVKGLYYHLIPQFFIGNEASARRFIEIVEGQNNGQVVDDLSSNVSNEQLVLRSIGKLDDSIAVNFLFLDTSSGASAEKIAMLVQDVYPSRLSKIFEAQDTVTSMYFTVFPKASKENKYQQNLFAVAREFFPKQKDNGGKKKKTEGKKSGKGFDKYFLSVTQNIFENKPMDNGFIYSSIMDKVVKQFNNMLAKNITEFEFLSTIKKAEMFVSFLLLLNLLKDRKEETMESEELFDDYFVKFKDLYNSPLKRGLFLLGVATRMFVDLQYDERGSKPFLTELKSFKMNLTDFRGLVPKLQNKIIEYDYVEEKWKLNRMSIALANASKYLLQVDKTNMSVQEMNFYFVTGYHQGWDVGSYIGSKLKEFKENNTNNEEVAENE